MVSIRKIQGTDADAVFGLMRIFYDSPAVLGKVPDEVIKTNIEDSIGDSPFLDGFVFEDEGRIVGYAMIAKSYSTEYGGICIWIEDIYIIQEYRDNGIGTRFLSYIEKSYADKAVRFRLEAEKDNVKAIELYRKSGYSELPYLEMAKSLQR